MQVQKTKVDIALELQAHYNYCVVIVATASDHMTTVC